MKKLLSFCLALAIIICAVPLGAFTLTVSAATSGVTGDCTWTLDGTVLTISGNGEMGDHYNPDHSILPWGTDITEVIIEDGVTGIGMGAFERCASLTSVIIGGSVTSIGDWAFYYCRSLANITIPNSVTSIGNYAFENCTSLTSIIIPDSVTSIGERAFYECDSMVSVTLPASVTAIGEYAFDDCFRLSKIWYMGTQEEKDAIEIAVGNSDLLTSTWYYNSCIESETHTYDNNADMFCNVCNATRKVGGDANGDGEINNKDLGALMRYINDWDIEIKTEDVDMNADGQINNRDYGILMRSLNGWTGDDIYSEGTNTGTSTPNTPSTPSTPTSLELVTDQDKILKDAFALGKNETTPYIAQLTGKVISINKPYDAGYGTISVIISVGGKNITCYNMKVGNVSGGSKLKARDTITVRGVIKNFYYDEADTSGTIEFTWDEASQTDVVLTELVVAVEPSTQLSVVDNPVVGTAYKFGFVSTSATNGGTYYAVGGMKGYYMATGTSAAVAVDVYLENANGGYYVYAMINGAKKYLDMQETGTHVNAVYTDTPGKVFTYNTEKKTLVTQCAKNGVTGVYAFGTHGSYTTIGTTDISQEGYECHFYK